MKMYCVKCGVRLQDGQEKCPLCGTPVWNPDAEVKQPVFPDRYPETRRNIRHSVAFALTVLAAVAVLILLPVAFELDPGFGWTGYALLGIALLYTDIVLPLWFRKSHPLIFIPVCHAAACGYLLYICLKTGGHWFLSFAFPVTGINCLLVTAVAALLLSVRGKRSRYFIYGGSIIAAGACTMLVELFQHITFGSVMFRWSLYSAGACLAVGMFLILAGIIRPLRSFLEKNFYI